MPFVFGLGRSFIKSSFSSPIPYGKLLIQATNSDGVLMGVRLSRSPLRTARRSNPDIDSPRVLGDEVAEAGGARSQLFLRYGWQD